MAVVWALLDVLGPEGTLVVPTHTPDNSEPSAWSRPPVPESWWPIIRASMPAFDPAITPSRYMGAIAEVVRTWPGARRSSHPQLSFAARRLLNVGGQFASTSRGLLNGPPDQWVEDLAGLTLEHGITGFILAGDDPEAIELYAHEVAPATRELVAAERA